MRLVLLAAAGVIACAGLAGCDEPSSTPAATAVAPPCNCQTAAAAPAPAVHRRHHRPAQSYAEDQSHDVYSGRAEYHGEPQVSQDNTTQTDEDENAAETKGPEAALWIDGYGRRHYGGPALAAAAPDSRLRRQPWRGYDAKCDCGDE